MIRRTRYAVRIRLSTYINHTLTSQNIFYNVRKRRTSAHHLIRDTTHSQKPHTGPNNN
jgi:hypothetical protein